MDSPAPSRARHYAQWVCALAVLVFFAVPSAIFWAVSFTAWHAMHGDTPAPTPETPPDASLLPRRHPPADSDPGPGYVWVRAHQSGSKWVPGYWRRRPWYVPPTPTPMPSASPAPQ